jgi:hypothetical protein
VAVEGVQLHHAYAAVTACRPAGSGACEQGVNNFSDDYSATAGIAAALLQGAKLVSLAMVVAVAAGAFSTVFSWSYGSLLGMKGYGYSPLFPTFFDLRGIAFAAWTLAAFAIGALAGVLIRRVVPAMFATLAAWSGLALATALFLRPHYRGALKTTNPNIGPPAQVISQWWTLRGKTVDVSALSTALRPVDVRVVTAAVFQPGPSTPANFDPIRYLMTHGFSQVASYQPGSRFWPFQWIEAGWLLGLSVLLDPAADRERREDDREVSFDGVALAVVDRPCLQVVLGHPEARRRDGGYNGGAS